MHATGAPRIIAEAVLDARDFRVIAEKLGTPPRPARKIALIAARQVHAAEDVASHWNGLETSNTAAPGDWIATSLDADGNVLRDADGHANAYVIAAANFAALYREAEGANAAGRFYAATGKVEVLHLAGGFDIIGRWGERQLASDGYLVLNGDEVYGNNAETFARTYAFLDDAPA